MAKALQERIKETVYASARLPWYRRWWGIALCIVIFLTVLWFIAFAVQVARFYREYANGAVPPGASLNELRQGLKVDLLHNSDDPSVGPATAPIVITAFEDFSCPFCFQAQPFLKKLLAKYAGDIRFIYKDFPLQSIHPDAQGAAEAAQCAHEQGKFWEYHDVLFSNQDRFAEAFYRATAKELGLNITAFNECLATGAYRQSINEDVELGRTLGVVGTPTFFINGELFAQGYSSDLDAEFEKAIEYIQSL